MATKTIVLGIKDPDNDTITVIGKADVDTDGLTTVNFTNNLNEDDLRTVTTGAVVLASAGRRLLNGHTEDGIGAFNLDESCRIVADDKQVELLARLINSMMNPDDDATWSTLPDQRKDAFREVARTLLDVLRKSDDPETDELMEQL